MAATHLQAGSASLTDAPWDALSVTELARDMPALAGVQRGHPNRSRFVLTDDQLHAEHVFWALGDNPFGWDPRSVDQDCDPGALVFEVTVSERPRRAVGLRGGHAPRPQARARHSTGGGDARSCLTPSDLVTSLGGKAWSKRSEDRRPRVSLSSSALSSRDLTAECLP